MAQWFESCISHNDPDALHGLLCTLEAKKYFCNICLYCTVQYIKKNDLLPEGLLDLLDPGSEGLLVGVPLLLTLSLHTRIAML